MRPVERACRKRGAKGCEPQGAWISSRHLKRRPGLDIVDCNRGRGPVHCLDPCTALEMQLACGIYSLILLFIQQRLPPALMSKSASRPRPSSPIRMDEPVQRERSRCSLFLLEFHGQSSCGESFDTMQPTQARASHNNASDE